MSYTHDVVIVGGGAGGLSAASGCVQLGLKTALIEKELMGGDCLYYGCVPSKTLIKSARVYRQASEFKKYGLPEVTLPKPDLGQVMDRVQSVITAIEPHDSPERYRDMGVEVLFGDPEFISPHEIKVDEKTTVSSKKIILATGSSPMVLPIPGLEEAGYITNMNIFTLRELPDHLITIGAGPIGVEMSQSFLRLGSKVTILDFADHVLPREDADVAEIIQKKLIDEGAEVVMGAAVKSVEANGASKTVTYTQNGKEGTVTGDTILLAAGRRGNTDTLGLDRVGIKTENSFILTDSHLKTSQKHVLAIGDCNGKYLFTHVAGTEGSLAVRNVALKLPVTMDYEAVPWCTYCDPEVASIGLNETRARERGIEYRVVESGFNDVDRALAEAATEGKVKILIDKKERIIGTQIVGAHAGELIISSIHAIRKKFKLMDLLSPIYPYPVLGEIQKKAAGAFLGKKLFNPKVRKILRTIFGYRGPA